MISVVTLRELENIKTASNKDEDTKAKARKIARLLDKHWDMVYISFIKSEDAKNQTNDEQIVYAVKVEQEAAQLERGKAPLFVTDDLCCKAIARSEAVLIGEPEDNQPHEVYKGYKTVTMTDDELAEFYSNMGTNTYDLLTNQYIRVLNEAGEMVDVRKWNGKEHVNLYNKGIKSTTFGDKLKPRDDYQRMAIDSIMSNTITILSGKPGSGKSLMALASIFSLIEKGVYDRLVVMSNPCKVRGASDLGFYTGDVTKKLMQNQIGNTLITKFGDRFIVDQMISQGKMRLMSVADCRGSEVRDNEILFVTEGQNLSIDMMRLILGRASQGCKVILDGDFETQVDSWAFEGERNGMRRAVEAFKGSELFGYVELPNIWRSKLAELAQKL